MLGPFWCAPIEAVLADLAARPEGLTQIEEHLALGFAEKISERARSNV